MIALRAYWDRVAVRPRLGVEVGCRSVHAVLVSHCRIVRTATVRLAEGEPLDEALGQLLDSTCRGQWRSPFVFAAIGPSASQLRRLTKLPSVASARVLRDVVKANAGTFFLKNGKPLLTSAVRQCGDGAGWAAALDEPPVRMLADVCRSRGLRLQLVIPSVVALPRALDAETLTTEDGDAAVELRVEPTGELRDVRRSQVEMGRVSPHRAATPRAALSPLGGEAADYAAAYGATTFDPSEPLALKARDFRAWRDDTVPAWRLLTAGAAVAIALALALVVPAFHARSVAAHAATRLASINGAYRSAHWTERELAATTGTLAELAAFHDSRRSIVGLLAELTVALPENAWLASLHVDVEGGTAIVLAPRAASVISALADVHAITAPAIAGAVSTEGAGADRAERVTVRFRWRGPVHQGGR